MFGEILLCEHKALKDQVVLVTGASSGIGEAIAKGMAAAGAKVAVNYAFNKKEADRVVGEIKELGSEGIAVKADVSKEKEVKDMYKKICCKFGTVDILVNNAGIQKDSPFIKMSLKDWQRVIDVNLTGYFLCAREAAAEFIRRGVNPKRPKAAAGKIICMSSVHEVIPWAGHVNYASSKGGVMLFMKTIAQELAPHKIRVNSIAPGAIKTNINKSAWQTAKSRKKLLELIPYDRVGETRDIAAAAIWLASDESDYVTGATLYVDGGMSLYPGFASGG